MALIQTNIERLSARVQNKLGRLRARLGVRLRRQLIWAKIRLQGAALGFAKRDLEHFHQYLSIHFGLKKPNYSTPLQQPPNYFPGFYEWTTTVDASRSERSERMKGAGREAPFQ